MGKNSDSSDCEDNSNHRKRKLVKKGEEVTEWEYNGLLAKVNKYSNKYRKRAEVAKLKKQKKKLKKTERNKRKEEAEALGEDAPPKNIPKTLETLRVPEPSRIDADDEDAVQAITEDEFGSYFSKAYVPKVIITSCQNPNLNTRLFLKEFSRIVPNSTVFHRRQSRVKTIIAKAIEQEYTDVVVINEHNKKPSSMLISHLPEGPTTFFKISNVKLTKNIKRDWKEITNHRPEVLLTNFQTHLGCSVSRMLASLFHYEPQFKGRRVVTFHNQRDYIFVRHHRYEFKGNGKKAALRELGPRFTLKVRSMQKGTFASKSGEYIFISTDKRHDLEKSRRRFLL